MTFMIYGIIPVPAWLAVGGFFAYDVYGTAMDNVCWVCCLRGVDLADHIFPLPFRLKPAYNLISERCSRSSAPWSWHSGARYGNINRDSVVLGPVCVGYHSEPIIHNHVRSRSLRNNLHSFFRKRYVISQRKLWSVA